MQIDKIHLAASEKKAKFPDGPISGVSPGPTFETAVIAAVRDIITDVPSKVNNSVAIMIVTI